MCLSYCKIFLIHHYRCTSLLYATTFKTLLLAVAFRFQWKLVLISQEGLRSNSLLFKCNDNHNPVTFTAVFIAIVYCQMALLKYQVYLSSCWCFEVFLCRHCFLYQLKGLTVFSHSSNKDSVHTLVWTVLIVLFQL